MIADEVEVVFKANTANYIADVNKAEANFRSKIGQMEAQALFWGENLKRTQKVAGQGFSDIARDAPRATTAIRGARVETGNLAAQFQDIGVQLAGGASPFTIISQQVPQIVAATGSVRGAIGGLGAALTQLISPVGLVSTAFILAASVAASYFSDLIGGADDSEEALKREEQLIQKIVDRWGDAVPSLKKYAEERKKLKDAAELQEATKQAVDRTFEEARAELPGLLIDIADIASSLDLAGEKSEKITKIRSAFDELTKAINEGRDSTKENKDLLDALADTTYGRGVPAIAAFVDKLKGLADGFSTAAQAAKAYREEATRALNPDIYGDANQGFYPTINLPDRAPAPDMRGVDDFGQSLEDMSDAIDGFVERVVNAESGGKANAKNPLSSATGVGQFIASTWADLFRRYFPAQASTMSRQQILAQRGDPEISRILIRRYAEENAKYLERAGVTITEAALQLAHFLGPRDAARVYNAAPGTPVQGLIGQAAINANRSILGNGATREDVLAYANRRASGGSGRTEREPPKDKAVSSLDDLRARIEATERLAGATDGLRQSTDAYTFAQEKQKVINQVLDAARAQGRELTDEEKKSLDELATKWANLEVAKKRNDETNKQLQKSEQDLIRSQEEFANFSKDVLGGFISDLVHGKSAAEALANALEKVGSKLLDIALDQLFAQSAGAGGGGGFLNSILSFFTKREAGGPVSAGRAYVVGEKRPELFVPNSAGRIIPKVPDMVGMTRGAAPAAGGFIRVDGTFEVINGNMVPLISGVSGIVAGQQVKQSNKTMAARLQQTQARGTS